MPVRQCSTFESWHHVEYYHLHLLFDINFHILVVFLIKTTITYQVLLRYDTVERNKM